MQKQINQKETFCLRGFRKAHNQEVVGSNQQPFYCNNLDRHLLKTYLQLPLGKYHDLRSLFTGWHSRVEITYTVSTYWYPLSGANLTNLPLQHFTISSTKNPKHQKSFKFFFFFLCLTLNHFFPSDALFEKHFALRCIRPAWNWSRDHLDSPRTILDYQLRFRNDSKKFWNILVHSSVLSHSREHIHLLPVSRSDRHRLRYKVQLSNVLKMDFLTKRFMVVDSVKSCVWIMIREKWSIYRRKSEYDIALSCNVCIIF